jgi:hypothetical protein
MVLELRVLLAFEHATQVEISRSGSDEKEPKCMPIVCGNCVSDEFCGHRNRSGACAGTMAGSKLSVRLR